METITTDEIRLELAAQRVRIAALEDSRNQTVNRLVALERLLREAGAYRAVEQAGHREAVRRKRYGAICALAGFLPAGPIETTAAIIERVCTRQIPAPSGADKYAELLRREYAGGSPSNRTIRRALTELTSC